jgi:hypothetical protein
MMLNPHLHLFVKSWSRVAVATVAGAVFGAAIAFGWPTSFRLIAFVEPSIVKGQPAIPLEDFIATSNSLAYAARVKQQLNSQVSAWTLRRQFFVTVSGKQLVIDCRAADRESAHRLADAVTQIVIGDFGRQYAAATAREREFEAVLLRSIATAEKDLEDFNRTLVDLWRRPFTDRDAIAVLLAREQVDERQRALTNLHRELRDLRVTLDVQSHDARLAGPQLERTPDPLNRAMVFAAAGGGLALLLSGMWFFVRAWLVIERARAESQHASVIT